MYNVGCIISQDGPKMYITVTSFDNTYLQWLRRKRAIGLPAGSSLTMARYGPWSIQHERDVAEFAAIVLAIMASEK
ncbi:hypothetical protein N7519_000067 [Penicillium mononematosum]|uniref:uncharacterized protein n=1 Tax=Penicillium mononematosum TaxID=268346 RepID=UPI002546688D|nr:uncharacterized protein N7519_000067 [Penicillium mononematosum]KAJ6190046.1 hypothetical protein N7519_000067 [Penicillium mononematosum]